MNSTPFRRLILLLAGASLGGVAGGTAQEPYRTPPEIIRKILDAPGLPALVVSPRHRLAALAEPAGMPTIADLAEPMLRLAGLRINPSTNARYVTRWNGGLRLRALDGDADRRVALPPGIRFGTPEWSPDGRSLALIGSTGEGSTLWIVDAGSGQVRTLVAGRLNGVMGRACSWTPDSQRLLCALVPAGRGDPPQAPPVPIGPIVQQSSGTVAPVRTYQDLLASPFDEARFRYYATARLAFVSAADGSIETVGEPGIFLEASLSPDGERLLVRRVLEPFSYLVPVRAFAQEIEVWSNAGERFVTLASVPLEESVPIGGVRTGLRNFTWDAGSGATLLAVEALDGGNTRRPAVERDRVLILKPPYDHPIEVARLGFRYRGVQWGRDLALVSEYDRRTRHRRTWVVTTKRPNVEPQLLFDYSTEDRYHDPGTPMLAPDGTGHRLLLQSGGGRYLYLRGPGASPEGDRPFLDRLDLRSGRTERLFRSGRSVYESVVAVLDPDRARVVTRREDRQTPPNYFLRDLQRERETPLTAMTNPAPELASVRRELLTYDRGDGVQLSGTLYYPTDYQPGQRVPVIFWIYPREFASAELASQVRGSPNRFVLPRGASQLFLLTQGYAVLDNPTLPVIGEGDTANDTYQEQTVAGAAAAIRHLEAMGVGNGRYGVGGHSYGAFATANLLAHSDLFLAGVARSGAYNRTLTPFGFQAEPRTFWEAPQLYLKMMPFAHVPDINEPLLLIHGMSDNNAGTFPIQSQRMYHALKGHGATVEYVQLPLESHGYRARESILDTIARTIAWYDRFVKQSRATSDGGTNR